MKSRTLNFQCFLVIRTKFKTSFECVYLTVNFFYFIEYFVFSIDQYRMVATLFFICIQSLVELKFVNILFNSFPHYIYTCIYISIIFTITFWTFPFSYTQIFYFLFDFLITIFVILLAFFHLSLLHFLIFPSPYKICFDYYRFTFDTA